MTKSDAVREREWQAEDDARTLTRAEEINSDSSRKKKAIVKVKQMVKEKEKEVTAFKKVAKVKPVKKKTATKRKTKK